MRALHWSVDISTHSAEKASLKSSPHGDLITNTSLTLAGFRTPPDKSVLPDIRDPVHIPPNRAAAAVGAIWRSLRLFMPVPRNHL